MAVLLHGQCVYLVVTLLVACIMSENEPSCNGPVAPSVVVNNYDAGGFVEERLERLEARINNTSSDDSSALTSEAVADLTESLLLLRMVLLSIKSNSPQVPSGQQDSPPAQHTTQPMRDCSDVVDVDNDSDGMYTIYPTGSNMPTRVYCEIRNDTNGRVAYTVIQQRVDETVDFHRNWKEYRDGFGEIGANTNFYIGNELIHQITSQRQYTIWFQGTRFARDAEYDSWEDEFTDHSEEDNMIYKSFSLMNEERRYAVLISQYTGHRDYEMTRTYDRDRYDYVNTYTTNFVEVYENNATNFHTFDYNGSDSSNCAQSTKSGWWFDGCESDFNVNLPYKIATRNSRAEGIPWRERHYQSMRVKIAPTFP